MLRRPPRSTRTSPLCPSTTRFRSSNGADPQERHAANIPRCTELENLMRADCLFAITAAGALALVAACSATDQPVVQETVQDTVPDTAHVAAQGATPGIRSEEHTSELKSLMRNAYSVFCLKK